MNNTQIKKAKQLVEAELKKVIESKVINVESIKKEIIDGLGISEKDYRIADVIETIEELVDKKYSELLPALTEIKDNLNNKFPIKYESIENKPDLESYKYDDTEIISKIKKTDSKTNIKFKKYDKLIEEVKKEQVKSHSDLIGIKPNDHHDEEHNLESHIESELLKKIERLTSGEEIDDLHKHKKGGTNAGLWNPLHYHDEVYYKKADVVSLIAQSSASTLASLVASLLVPPEDLTAQCDGTNLVFTTTNSIQAIIWVSVSGGMIIEGIDFTITGDKEITLSTFAPDPTYDQLLIKYI